MSKALVLTLMLTVNAALAAAAPTTRTHQTKHRKSSSRAAAERSAAAQRSASALKGARDKVTGEIKTLNHFLYLYGGIAKGIETADLSARARETSAAAIDQGEHNKAKVRDSLRNVHQGLEKLESELRADPALGSYSSMVAGLGDIGATAESQAAANRFDEAGRTLLKAVDRLADLLAAMH